MSGAGLVDDLRLGRRRGGAVAPSFLGKVAGTGSFVLPIHFPHPTTGLVEADGNRFRYKFVR
jgi:hypothetical protein